ncbi:hypothetical protein O0881_04215 [Janthinobacterium sp. SUN100]|nr:hypothetical protein [Janthinobacterium sp. SUN100]MDN2701202.1 hypothetical protein [Janthinobacterium sp. SUN100]
MIALAGAALSGIWKASAILLAGVLLVAASSIGTGWPPATAMWRARRW